MEKSRLDVYRNFSFLLAAGFLIAGLLMTGCASHPCREPRQPELDQTKSAPGSLTPATITSPATASKNGEASNVTRVRIYKPDGSRQCEKRGAQSVETMERELAGIVVHSREKRKDGLMHIQICGSPTGMINLYEIDASFLKQAEERGFKRLED